MQKIMKNLSLSQGNHHTHPCTSHPCKTLFSPMYCSSKNMQDLILTHELLIREYALACLGPCTAHAQFSYLLA